LDSGAHNASQPLSKCIIYYLQLGPVIGPAWPLCARWQTPGGPPIVSIAAAAAALPITLIN